MDMLSAFGGDKHELCIVAKFKHDAIFQAMTSLIHDCIE